jgi:hypothetical protein
LQKSTKRELDDLSIILKGCHECAALSVIPRVQWSEKGAVCWLQSICLRVDRETKSMKFPRNAPTKDTTSILAFFPAFKIVKRNGLLMTPHEAKASYRITEIFYTTKF